MGPLGKLFLANISCDDKSLKDLQRRDGVDEEICAATEEGNSVFPAPPALLPSAEQKGLRPAILRPD
jgi:hypothetical protein